MLHSGQRNKRIKWKRKARKFGIVSSALSSGHRLQLRVHQIYRNESTQHSANLLFARYSQLHLIPFWEVL